MSELKRITDLANLMVTQRKYVEEMEERLTAAKSELRRIETEDLPELMREIGMKSFQLEDGSVVEVTDEVDCSITEANRARAHDWLLANGFGGLIKTEVVVAFGKGEHEAAMKCAEEVGGVAQERVHPSTLKSFIKEQMAKGAAVPFDLFSVHPYSKAKLKSKR